MPADDVVAELLAATHAAVNHSRELLSIAQRLLVNAEGGPAVPAETRADYWRRFAEMDDPVPRSKKFWAAGPS